MSLSPSQRKSTSLRAVDFKRQIEHPGSTFDLSNDESLEIWSALQATGERQSGSFIDMLNTCLRGLVRQGGQAVRPTVLRAYANGAVTSQQSSSEVDIKQGWDELQANASTSEGRKELADLRRIVADLTKTPDEVPPINWEKEFEDFDKDIIAKCKEAIEGIEDDMPEFSLDELIEEAEAEFGPLVAESKEMAAQAEKEIQKLEKELKTLDHLQEKLGTMTTHEALASSPEIAAEVDKEISEGNYMP